MEATRSPGKMLLNQKVVRNLKDAMEYVDDALDVLFERADEDPSEIDRIFDNLAEDSLSTAFSGVGAAEVATKSFYAALQKRCPSRCSGLAPTRISHQIDWDTDCQRELLAGGGDACVFGDIMQFFRPELLTTIAALKERPSLIMDVLGPAVKAGVAMKLDGACLRHGGQCVLREARRHVAGTSCTAHSKQGGQRGLNDATSIHLLAWMGLRRQLQEADIVQENVTSFPVSVLNHYLGDLYFIDHMKMGPEEFGWAILRDRQFVKLRHRVKIIAEISPMSRFVRRFHRLCAFTWKDFFFLHEHKDWDKAENPIIPDEAVVELKWAQSRRKSLAADTSVTTTASRGAYYGALTQVERDFDSGYEDRWPNCCRSLQQDPACHAMRSVGPYMHTMIRNLGIVWAPHVQRWLLPTEALVAMGFPTHPRNSASGHLCSYNIKLDVPRTGRHVCARAGNTMHLNVILAVMMHSLACYDASNYAKLFDVVTAARRSAPASSSSSLSPLAPSIRPADALQGNEAACTDTPTAIDTPHTPSRRLRRKTSV